MGQKKRGKTHGFWMFLDVSGEDFPIETNPLSPQPCLSLAGLPHQGCHQHQETPQLQHRRLAGSFYGFYSTWFYMIFYVHGRGDCETHQYKTHTLTDNSEECYLTWYVFIIEHSIRLQLLGSPNSVDAEKKETMEDVVGSPIAFSRPHVGDLTWFYIL